jgi:tight adherence protein B
MVAATFAGVLVLFLAVALSWKQHQQSTTDQRLADRLRSLSYEAERVDPTSLLQEDAVSSIELLNTLLKKMRQTDDLQRLLVHAGVKLRPGEAILWMALGGMITAALVFLLKDGNVLWSALGFVMGGPVLVLKWLKGKRKKRRGAVMKQLVDALEMIRSSLQAGHSLPQSLEAVAEEMPDPLATEFRQVNEELRLGHPMRDALNGIHERTGLDDLRFFIVAITLNREIGGNLSDIIGVVASTLRERFKLKAQVQSLTAQGRMSAMVLTALAPFLFVAVNFLNPEYMEPMFNTAPGRFMTGYCVVSVLFGYWLMRKIVDIKVIRTD